MIEYLAVALVLILMTLLHLIQRKEKIARKEKINWMDDLQFLLFVVFLAMHYLTGTNSLMTKVVFGLILCLFAISLISRFLKFPRNPPPTRNSDETGL